MAVVLGKSGQLSTADNLKRTNRNTEDQIRKPHTNGLQSRFEKKVRNTLAGPRLFTGLACQCCNIKTLETYSKEIKIFRHLKSGE